jgi:hypothetical protein
MRSSGANGGGGAEKEEAEEHAGKEGVPVFGTKKKDSFWLCKGTWEQGV